MIIFQKNDNFPKNDVFLKNHVFPKKYDDFAKKSPKNHPDLKILIYKSGINKFLKLFS